MRAGVIAIVAGMIAIIGALFVREGAISFLDAFSTSTIIIIDAVALATVAAVAWHYYRPSPPKS